MLWFWAALLAASLWGLSYAMAENVLKGGISSTSLMAFYTWIAAPIFTVIAWRNGSLRQGISLARENPSFIFSIVALVVCYFIGNLLIYWAIKQKDATTVSLIEISYPLFVALFSYVIFNNMQLTWQSALGGMLILSGVAVMSFVR